MKPQQFKLLSDPAKLNFIKTKCTLIANRNYLTEVYELYQSGRLYIELQANVTTRVYRQFFCFTDTVYLDAYLENVDISGLCA